MTAYRPEPGIGHRLKIQKAAAARHGVPRNFPRHPPLRTGVAFTSNDCGNYSVAVKAACRSASTMKITRGCAHARGKGTRN